MQFIIHAYDGTDENTTERRMAARPAHLENIVKVDLLEIRETANYNLDGLDYEVRLCDDPNEV